MNRNVTFEDVAVMIGAFAFFVALDKLGTLLASLLATSNEQQASGTPRAGAERIGDAA